MNQVLNEYCEALISIEKRRINQLTQNDKFLVLQISLSFLMFLKNQHIIDEGIYLHKFIISLIQIIKLILTNKF